MNATAIAIPQQQKPSAKPIDIVTVVIILLWLIVNFGSYFWSISIISSHDTGSTYEYGQSYGTTYEDYTSYSFQTRRNLGEVNAMQQYWLDYYTATETTETTGSAEHTTTGSPWYAIPAFVSFISMFFLFILTQLSDAIVHKKRKTLAIGAYVLLTFALVAYNASKLQFLWWITH